MYVELLYSFNFFSLQHVTQFIKSETQQGYVIKNYLLKCELTYKIGYVYIQFITLNN